MTDTAVFKALEIPSNDEEIQFDSREELVEYLKSNEKEIMDKIEQGIKVSYLCNNMSFENSERGCMCDGEKVKITGYLYESKFSNAFGERELHGVIEMHDTECCCDSGCILREYDEDGTSTEMAFTLLTEMVEIPSMYRK